MTKQKILSLILCVSMVLTGCASGNGTAVIATISPTSGASQPQSEETAMFTNRDMDGTYDASDGIPIVLDKNGIHCDSSHVSISGTIATIQEEGTYLLSGTLEDGSILVDTGKTGKVQLVLNGVSIHSETSAPVYVRKADKVFVTLAGGTQNSLSGGDSFTPDGNTNVDAVIFSKEDLTLNGSGSLSVTSPAGHAIVSKDSLRVTGGTYVIDASEHGLLGKDEVSIADGNFAITSGKDGIHSENSDDSELGTVYIAGGVFRITAQGDGISASGSCRMIDGEYTITAGGGSGNAQQQASNPSFDKGQHGGRPVDSASSATKQTNNPQEVPEKGNKGGIGGGKDRMEPPQASVEAQAASPTDPVQADAVSAKGIKAADLVIDGGSFHVDSADDGLHANGELTVHGGVMEISSGDDGIHADETVTISSGSIRIAQSYEGIEGQNVRISGGQITLTATNDGLNAAGGMDSSGFGRHNDTFVQTGDTPSILISGGSVKITASGDGIDANGVLEITGGTVTVCGPAWGDTSVLDFDITGSISGGTFIGTGASAMTQTFKNDTQGVITVRMDTQTAGTEILLIDSNGNEVLSQTPELDFDIVIISTPEIRPGESFTLCVGDATQTVTA